MQQALIVAGIFLSSNLVAFTIYCIKNKGKEDKIEIMSVRSRVRKIEKINKESKQSTF